MDRCHTYGNNEAIEVGLLVIPPLIRKLLERTHYLVGADPLFVGLHTYETTGDGRSYRSTVHCAYAYHQLGLYKSERHTTIVLPLLEKWPETVTHELGHVLDEILGFRHEITPISEYAKTNRREAFACAFSEWCLATDANLELAPYGRELLKMIPQAVTLFEELARYG